MSLFWTLVKNDLRFQSKGAFRGIWPRIYMGFIVLLGLSFFTFQVLKGHIWPGMLLLGIPFMVFIAFSSAIRTVKYEWRDDTVAWWLSLPYPRWYLLAAKLMASFIRYLKHLAYIVGFSIIISLLGMILNPLTWNSQTLWSIFKVGIHLYLWIILMSPAVMMMGITFILLQRSRWKPLSPLFIVIMSFAFSGIFTIVSNKNTVFFDYIIGIGGGQLFVEAGGVVLAGIAAALLFVFSTYLLERQIEV